MRMRSSLAIAALAAACVTLGSGCSPKKAGTPFAEFRLGERVGVGSLTYNVIETSWASQLGAVPIARFPERNFLLVHLSVTNGGGQSASIPFLSVENAAGERFQESENGQGVDAWLGMFREVKPAETEQGWILFDVPTNSYRLQLVDGGEGETEHAAYVTLPLHLD
jgi:hypothetical protein